MYFKKLKTNIAVHLSILLMAAIGLTDFVLIRIIENQLIDSRLAATEQWLFTIDADSNRLQKIAADFDGQSGNKAALDIDITCLIVSVENGQQRHFGLSTPVPPETLSGLNRQVMETRQPAHRFIGRIWGVFWMQNNYVAITIPAASLKGTVTAVIDLQPLYRNLRSSQKAVFFYLIIHFTILLLLGTYRLTRLVTRPIQRLTKLTDTYYQTSDYFDLFSAKQDDEFGRLSSALNRMLKRIEQDKWMLRQSIDSIEAANQELKQAQQEIIRAEKLASTGRLSAGIAHEIGNPIGIVLGYLGLLKNRSLPAETAIDYIKRAETEINRINTIIRQLLDFSRTAPETASVFSVHDLLRDVVEVLSRTPLMKNIRIDCQLSASSENVFADYNQLHQVIVNLLINAADSIAAGKDPIAGRIDLITRINVSDNPGLDPMLQLLVRDNGCGIPAESVDKIFDPFFTTKEPGKGTGLGLSVSYMIIERFGGVMEARCDDGGGTTLAVYLPLVNAEEFLLNTGPS